MNYKYIIVLFCIALPAYFLYWYFLIRPTKYGTVIILNGPSASGKSSIQKEFQSITYPDSVWIKVGIDNLFDTPMPNITPENMHLWQSQNNLRWVETSKDNHENNIITLFVGPDGDKIAYGMNSAIAAYAQNECNVIVDYIAYKKEWIIDLQNKLANIQTYWIKVDIPLEILEQRERTRATSPAGHARSHYDTVHWNIAYNLIVNSHTQTAAEIAQKMKEFVTNKYLYKQKSLE
ncbi:hypothetical protein EBR77_00195 [bacterium]|nr:hypothetical protein [bacterium]NBX78605.1 hypothetical protein [bacterium]